MKLTKILIGSLYTLIVVCIGLATVVEKYRGTAFVGDNIYGAWWFSALWGVLTVAALAYILKRRLYKRLAVFVLHLAFVVILVGALTTHLTARSGIVRLRKGVPEMTYVDNDRRVQHLPFSLLLKEFRVVNYPGTDAPLDYQSVISVSPGGEAVISMNHIGSIDGYRLFQQSYDSDGLGVTLGLRYDPYGIAITYSGYLILLIGIIATLLSRKTKMRALYRKAVTALLFFVSITTSAGETTALPNAGEKTALPSVPADIAHRMGTIHVLYNNRICPLNTVATDFTMKITGSASWHGYSADEVFFSWMIYYGPWERSLTPDPSPTGEGSIYSQGQKVDERRAIVEMFYSGQFTKIFPYSFTPDPYSLTPSPSSLTPDPSPGERGVYSSSTDNFADNSNHSPLLGRGAGGEAIWFSPGSQVLPREIPVKEQFFIKQSMDFLTEAIVTGQHDRAIEIIAKIKLFQRDMIGDLLPSNTKTQAEIFFNTLRAQKWPVFLSLTLSLLLCVLMLFEVRKRIIYLSLLTFIFLLFAYVTLHLALRWWLSGHIPVSNGPETMLFMAWAVLLLTISLSSKSLTPSPSPKERGVYTSFAEDSTVNSNHSPLLGRGVGGEAFARGAGGEAISFGPLIASFCLLVAMLGGNSEITPLMPVLQSPLLSIHVMTVMCAYALFALQMLLGMQALFLIRKGAQLNLQSSIFNLQLERVTALSQFLLYPAVFLLTIGIFLGAVWANVSWGCYWSWDPKESWALITLMVYAVPLHLSPLTSHHSPLTYHVYMVVAFLAVLITYFGVNYLLGGMHSYA